MTGFFCGIASFLKVSFWITSGKMGNHLSTRIAENGLILICEVEI